MLLRCRLSRRWTAVRYVAALCTVAAATLTAYFYFDSPVPWHHSQCRRLQFDELATAAFPYIGGGTSDAGLRPEAHFLGFDGHEANCTNNLPTVAELSSAAKFKMAASGEQIDDGVLVEITYRTCCIGGPKQRPCTSAEKPLRLPTAAANAALASGKRAVRNISSLSSRDLAGALVFVTAASADHFEESLALLRSVHRHFQSGARIVYWDLGLRKDQRDTVAGACGVEYRRFDFSKYPPHVAILRTYAFKPLAIMETFAAGYSAIWWVDASIRFTSSCVERVLDLAKERHGLLLFREPVHSIWSTTYPQMYDYIATNKEELKRTVTAPGTTFVVVNTQEIFASVLFWFYACALDQRCIAPVVPSGECHFSWYGLGNAAWLGGGHFAGCHRFDQSLLTILAANLWGFDSSGYRYRQKEFIIDRQPDGDSGVQMCSSEANPTADARQQTGNVFYDGPRFHF